MKTILSICLLLICSVMSAQSVEELYEARNFEELIKYEDQATDLSGIELYYLGYAFFQMENDDKAIQMYDKAIEKGLEEDFVFLYKGLSYRFKGEMENAIKNFEIAIEKNPTGQKNYTELGHCYYGLKRYEKALEYYYKAREQPYELGDPYLRIPNIYHLTNNDEKALEECYKSVDLIDKKDPVYVQLLMNIGLTETGDFKNYKKGIAAYLKVYELDPKNYEIYPELIVAYYGDEQFDKGNELIATMTKAFENNELSEEYQKFGSIPIARFEWNNRQLVVYKYFKKPVKMLDVMYKIYLLSEDAQSIDRTLVTEKTIQLEDDGAKHLLCENGKDGTHYTYAYGWSTDDIDFNSLKKAVIAVLEEEITPAASSKRADSSDDEEEGKSKKKKERRKKKKNQ